MVAGQLVGRVWSYSDITQQRMTEKALLEETAPARGGKGSFLDQAKGMLLKWTRNEVRDRSG